MVIDYAYLAKRARDCPNCPGKHVSKEKCKECIFEGLTILMNKDYISRYIKPLYNWGYESYDWLYEIVCEFEKLEQEKDI